MHCQFAGEMWLGLRFNFHNAEANALAGFIAEQFGSAEPEPAKPADVQAVEMFLLEFPHNSQSFAPIDQVFASSSILELLNERHQISLLIFEHCVLGSSLVT